MIFFVGGLWLRNPNLPSYLYSEIVNRLSNRNSAGSGELKPAASPRTAEDYLALTQSDLTKLSPAQKAVVLALANVSAETEDAQDRLTHLTQIVRNELPSLKSADAIAAYQSMRTDATHLLDAADQQKDLFENLQSNLATQLEKCGLGSEIAAQVAHLFYQGTPGQTAVDEAKKQQKLATELIAVANLLSETPGKWQVSSDGTIRSSDKKLDEEYRVHRAALEEAIGRGAAL